MDQTRAAKRSENQRVSYLHDWKGEDNLYTAVELFFQQLVASLHAPAAGTSSLPIDESDQ